MLLLYFVCKLGVARSYRKLKLFSSTLECFSCGRGSCAFQVFTKHEKNSNSSKFGYVLY